MKNSELFATAINNAQTSELLAEIFEYLQFVSAKMQRSDEKSGKQIEYFTQNLLHQLKVLFI